MKNGKFRDNKNKIEKLSDNFIVPTINEELFLQLFNKDTFYELCNKLNLCHPETVVYDFSKDKLEEFMYRDRKQLPEQASISKAEVSNHFELSETDLKKFNDSTNKVLSEHKNQTIRTNSVEKNKEE